MAWDRPQLSDGEIIHVDCTQVFSNGTRFDLLVTDRQLAYTRRKSFAVSDPVETIVTPLDGISDARVTKASPWGLWLLGTFLFVVFGLYVWSLLGDRGQSFRLAFLFVPALGFACFLSSTHRYRLHFRTGARTHLLKQPLSYDRVVRDAMAGALTKAGEVLVPTPGIVDRVPMRGR